MIARHDQVVYVIAHALNSLNDGVEIEAHTYEAVVDSTFAF